MFAATMSDPNKPYIGSHGKLFPGIEGQWIVWDVMLGDNGCFARLVEDDNDCPKGFYPVMDKDVVCGYRAIEVE